jgi:hypothetical protein
MFNQLERDKGLALELPPPGTGEAVKIGSCCGKGYKETKTQGNEATGDHETGMQEATIAANVRIDADL